MKNCVQKSIANCVDSSNYEPYECFECADNFFLREGACVAVATKIDDCLSYSDTSVCTKCVKGTALSSDGLSCISELEIVS